MAVTRIEPPQSNDRILAYDVDGEFTTEDMKAMISDLQVISDQGLKALLLIDMADFEGTEFGAVSEKFQNLGMLWGAFDRYAIVGATSWMQWWVKVIDPVTPQAMKGFDKGERDAAFAWLTAEETADAAEPAEA